MADTKMDLSTAFQTDSLKIVNSKLNQSSFTHWKAKEVRELFKKDNLAANQEIIFNYLKDNIVKKLEAEINKNIIEPIEVSTIKIATPKAMQLYGLLQAFINLNLFATSLARKNYSFNEKCEFQRMVTDFYNQCCSNRGGLINLGLGKDLTADLLAKYILTFNTHIYKNQTLRSIRRVMSLGLIVPTLLLLYKKDKIAWISGAKQTTSLTKNFKALVSNVEASLLTADFRKLSNTSIDSKNWLKSTNRVLLHSHNLSGDEISKRLRIYNRLLMAGCSLEPQVLYAADFNAEVAKFISQSKANINVDTLASVIELKPDLNKIVLNQVADSLLIPAQNPLEVDYTQKHPQGLAIKLIFDTIKTDQLLIDRDKLIQLYKNFPNFSQTQFKRYMEGNIIPNQIALITFLYNVPQEFKQNNSRLIIKYLYSIYSHISDSQQESIKYILNDLLLKLLINPDTALRNIFDYNLLRLLQAGIDKGIILNPFIAKILQPFLASAMDSMAKIVPPSLEDYTFKVLTEFLQQANWPTANLNNSYIQDLTDKYYALIGSGTDFEANTLRLNLEEQQAFLNSLNNNAKMTKPKDLPEKIEALKVALTAQQWIEQKNYLNLNHLKQKHYDANEEFYVSLVDSVSIPDSWKVNFKQYQFIFKPNPLLEKEEIARIFEYKFNLEKFANLLANVQASGLEQQARVNFFGYDASKGDLASLSKSEKDLLQVLFAIYKLAMAKDDIQQLFKETEKLPFLLTPSDLKVKYLLPIILQMMPQLVIEIKLGNQPDFSSKVIVKATLSELEKDVINRKLVAISNNKDEEVAANIAQLMHEFASLDTLNIQLSIPSHASNLVFNKFTFPNAEYSLANQFHIITPADAGSEILSLIEEYLLSAKPENFAQLDKLTNYEQQEVKDLVVKQVNQRLGELFSVPLKLLSPSQKKTIKRMKHNLIHLIKNLNIPPQLTDLQQKQIFCCILINYKTAEAIQLMHYFQYAKTLITELSNLLLKKELQEMGKKIDAILPKEFKVAKFNTTIEATSEFKLFELKQRSIHLDLTSEVHANTAKTHSNTSEIPTIITTLLQSSLKVKENLSVEFRGKVGKISSAGIEMAQSAVSKLRGKLDEVSIAGIEMTKFTVSGLTNNNVFETKLIIPNTINDGRTTSRENPSLAAGNNIKNAVIEVKASKNRRLNIKQIEKKLLEKIKISSSLFKLFNFMASMAVDITLEKELQIQYLEVIVYLAMHYSHPLTLQPNYFQLTKNIFITGLIKFDEGIVNQYKRLIETHPIFKRHKINLIG